MKEAQIFIEGVINPGTTDEVKRQLALNQDSDSFAIHISSPGGSVYDGYKIYHSIKQAAQTTGKAKPIRTIVEGEAQSMASFLSQLADKGAAEIGDPSRFMIHNPSQGIQGTADQLRDGADELVKIEEEMAQVYSSRTGIPIETIKAMMKKETRMSAQEAIKLGFVDKISTHLRAVALGKPMENKTALQEIAAGLKKLVGMTSQLTSPTGLELPLKAGGSLNVEGDGGDLMGKAATLDGQPAEGEYPLADGRVVVCAGGLVTEVRAAAVVAPVETAEQKQIKELQAKIDAANAEKVAAEQAKIAAEKVTAEQTKVVEEVKQTAVALGEEIEKLKNKTVGDENKPNAGMVPNRQPVGFGGSKPDQKAIYASRTWIADNMPWMEKFYKDKLGRHGRYEDGTDFFSYRSEGGPNAVSILETSFSYTWNGILTTDLFFKPTINSPALSDLLTVDPGTSDKKQYNIVAPLSKVLLPYTGCTSSPNGNRALITNKTIQVKEFRMYEGWCKDDFTGQLSGSYNFLAQEWLKTGESSFDPAGTPIDKIIVRQLKDALRRDVFRRVFFADADSSDVDYNQFNGFWPSLIDQSSTNAAYCVYREGTALGIGTLAADTASARFTSMYNNSPLLLKQEFIDTGMAQFLVTRSVWDNYYTTLVGVGSVSEQEYLNYLQGIKRLTFRGIPVIPINLWDQFLAESDNPMTGTSRHLIALTPKENHILGVEDVGDMSKIDSWYEMKDSKRYYRADMKMGFLGPIHCELTSIAY